MEELIEQDSLGFFSRVGNMLRKNRDIDPDFSAPALQMTKSEPRMTSAYTVTVRRGIATFDDAVAAAAGLKNGEQQILNLNDTDPALRQKIVDFMAGVNYAQEGNWEEVGENVFVVTPHHAYLEVAPASARMTAVSHELNGSRMTSLRN